MTVAGRFFGTAAAAAVCFNSAAVAQTLDQPVITYVDEVSPIAFAPSFKITIAPSGRGTVSGIRGLTGFVRPFAVEPRTYRAFAAALLPFRPVGMREVPSADPQTAKRDCPTLSTDQDTIEVTWFGAADHRDHLSYYLGCNDENGHFKGEGLMRAPDLLPIKPILEKMAARLRSP